MPLTEREQPPSLSLGMCDPLEELPYQEDRNSHPYMGLYKSCSFLGRHMCQHRSFHIPCTPCCLDIPDLQNQMKMGCVNDVFIRALKSLHHYPTWFSSLPPYLVCKIFYLNVPCFLTSEGTFMVTSTSSLEKMVLLGNTNYFTLFS